MTTSKAIYGSSTPRLATPALGLPSAGEVVANLASEVGLELMPWQRYVLDDALQVRPDGSWARGTCGVLVARQNGKTALMRMRILAGLYVFGEAQTIAMAQTRQLALDTFKQVVDMAEGVPWMRKRIKRVSRTNGQEDLEVWCEHWPQSCPRKCSRIRRYAIRAATSEGPRGATADLLYVDELREITPETWAAATPVTRARPNAQTWITSNAGDSTSTVLNELRSRALLFDNPRLGWYEWSAPTDDVHDITNWQAANPALGHTVSLESLQQSAAVDTPEAVLTEMLCRWVAAIDTPWPMETWHAGETDIALTPGLPTWMGLDLTFKRDAAYLVTVQADGELLNVYLHEFEGLSDVQLASEIAELHRAVRPRVLAYDPNTAGYIAPVLARAGVPVAPTPWQSAGFAIMCDQALNAMATGRLQHPPSETLNKHLVACARRPASDGGWRIARRASTTPISAAVALVMAVGYAVAPQEIPQIITA
jgi:phage terminase large subunit-like protein